VDLGSFLVMLVLYRILCFRDFGIIWGHCEPRIIVFGVLSGYLFDY
jgi:hypothetical protein